MARARNIKPGLYKNEDLAECSIWARFIFPGLWMLADREGRLEDRPKRIKGELLPFDSQDAEPLLRELEARSFILRYKNSDGSFIQILKFKEHQTPHYSEKESVIKPPDFQESTPHDEPSKPDNSGEDASLRGGRNPLNPDSLNPSLLNPEKKTRPQAVATIPGVEDSLVSDWLEVRKAKKAGKLTATAIKGLQREAMKAGLTLTEAITACCEFGWQGFNAQWYIDRRATKPAYTPPAITVPGKPGIDPALQKCINDAAKAAPPPPEIRARMKELSRAAA